MRRTARLVAGALVGISVLAGIVVPATADPSGSPAPTADPFGSPAPSADPSGSPAPTSTGTHGPNRPAGGEKRGAGGNASGQHPADAHDSAALVAALRALRSAETDLTLARGALDTARRQLVQAQAADARAQTDLAAAVLSEQRTRRELAEVRRRIQVHQDALGRLARSAYRSNGQYGEIDLILASGSPEQLTDRLAFVQTIANAGNAVIDDLREARADLRNAQSRLVAVRERRQAVRDAAAAALQEKIVTEQQAASAERQVGLVATAHRAALASVLRAKVDDRRRYRVLLVQSGALAARIQDLAAQLARSPHPPKGTGRFMRPGTGPLTSPYGPRLHPILGYVKIHTGVDLGRGDGLVYAADRGVVVLTEHNVAYGNMTVIDHGKVGGLRLATLYAHQSAFAVRPGDRVRKGQPIGVVGSTGYATGPHLHFEVRVAGIPIDPAPFLEHAPLSPAARAAAAAART